jgi:hypothetical protein
MVSGGSATSGNFILDAGASFADGDSGEKSITVTMLEDAVAEIMKPSTSGWQIRLAALRSIAGRGEHHRQ